jgi:FAD dependent monooxygenase
MLDRPPGHDLTTADIEQALQKYQLMRQRRANKFVEVSAVVTRDEALATFRHSIKFLSLPALLSDRIAGASLNCLTLPKS